MHRDTTAAALACLAVRDRPLLDYRAHAVRYSPGVLPGMSDLDHTPALTDLHCLSGDTNEALACQQWVGGHNITEYPYESRNFRVPWILYSERRGDKVEVPTRGSTWTDPTGR